MAFGQSPTTTTEGPIASNQIFISSVATPNTANGDLTALEGGPVSTDSNGNKTAPASMYVKDGNDVTQGSSGDANTVNSVMGRLTKIRDLLNATLTVAISGNVTEANSASIKADLDAILAALDDGQETMANSLSVAIASDQSAVPVSGTVTANAGTNLNTSLLALESGGHLASIDSHTPVLGQATMANSSPVVLASNQSNVPINLAQILGAALSATNPMISQAQYIAAVQAGKIYSASIGQKTYGAGVYAGMSIFNNSSAKNVLILSFRIFNSGASQAAFLYLTATTDPAFGTALTPSNNLAGGAASAIAANCSYALSGLSQPGTGLKYANQASTNTSATTGGEMIPRDCPILLPAGSANGVAGYLGGSSSNSIFMDCTWMEY